MRVALLFVLIAMPALARADASVTYDMAGGNCSTEPAALHVSGVRVRMDLAPVGGTEQSMLYDVVDETMVYLDHTAKTQFMMETDRDAADFQADVASATVRSVDKEMGKMQAQMDETCKEMERQGYACPKMPDMTKMMSGDVDEIMAMQQEQLAQVDPKLLERAGVDVEKTRSELEATRKQLAGPAGELREAGTETVAGRTCRVMERRDGEVVTDWHCDVDPAALGIGERDARGLGAAVRDLMRYGEAFAPLVERFGGKQQRERDNAYSIMLARRCYENGKEVGRATARIATDDLDDAMFEVPPSYAPLLQGAQ